MDLSRWETGETMADRVAVHQHEACRRSTSKDRLTASSRVFNVEVFVRDLTREVQTLNHINQPAPRLL
jgi:hypothetical protein